MNKSMLIGTVIGVTVAAAAAGFAGYSMLGNGGARLCRRTAELLRSRG